MEPTASEKDSIINLDSLAEWCGLQTSDTEPRTSTRGSLFALLGCSGISHYRLVAMMPSDVFTQALSTWKVGEASPLPAQMAAANLLHVTARCLCGLDSFPSQAATQQQLQSQIDLLKAQAAASNTANSAQATIARIKLAVIIDQSKEEEVVIMPDAEIQKCYSEYDKVMGGPPDPDVEGTNEQLTGIKHLIDTSRPPYADFAIFGPHGHRMARKLKLAGMVIDGSGQLRQIEMLGPPTYEDWDKCYGILRTLLVMLRQVVLVRLDRYRTLIHDYAVRYGPKVWHIIYQADVRCRREHMERLRRIAVEESAATHAKGGWHPLDPTRPWDLVWLRAVDDVSFWRKELEEPAVLVLTHTASLSSMVHGDAPVEHSTSAASQHSHVPPPPPAAVRGAPSVGPRKKAKIHVTNSEGLLLQNRSGKDLCPGFQTGACQDTLPGTIQCAKDPTKWHQCAKCLAPAHGASHCSGPLPKPPSQWVARGRGGGQRKGNKGGGKGRPY